MVDQHTVKAFDEDINRLRGLIAEMGGRVETAIEEAMTALVQQDEKKAKARSSQSTVASTRWRPRWNAWWSRSSRCARRWRTTCAR
jgi:site-specific recombinase XerD